MFFPHFSANKNRNEIRQIFPQVWPSLPLGHSRGGIYYQYIFSTFKPIKTGTKSGKIYRFNPRYGSGNIHILCKDRKSIGEQQYNSCRICRF
ncbi:hypothetical protein EVA_12961 [gut metagenome]|uniref:Uncharacterized protein n=1 Tax=gut metagenome TaxID=749906 RepID=J9CFV6_9ZZZZ